MSDGCPFKFKDFPTKVVDGNIIASDLSYTICKLITSYRPSENDLYNECVGEVLCPIMKK